MSEASDGGKYWLQRALEAAHDACDALDFATLDQERVFIDGFLAGRVSSAPSREAIAEAIYLQIEFKVTHEMWKEFVEAGIADIYFAAADAVVALMKENQGDKG